MNEIFLEDDFSKLEVGVFSADVGAHTEYHYLPEAAPKGNWTVAAFTSGAEAGQAWHVQCESQASSVHIMAQTFSNPHTHTHPMLSGGDSLWRDYSVALRFTPQVKRGQSGLAFRFRNSRCYYFFGFDEHGLVLKVVQTRAPFTNPMRKFWQSILANGRLEQPYTARVSLRGDQIQAEMEGLPTLEVNDDRYPHGQIALLADLPTIFHHIKSNRRYSGEGAFPATQISPRTRIAGSGRSEPQTCAVEENKHERLWCGT